MKPDSLITAGGPPSTALTPTPPVPPQPACSTHAPPLPAPLTDLSVKYKGFLLDQFGVLHDGRQPYAGAIEAVGHLAAGGGKIVILSNSSRRSSGTLGRLSSMGFQESWFAGAITSGELTHRYLSTRPSEWWQLLGSRCLHITWGTRGAVSIDDLGLQVVADPAAAEFIVVHGTQALGQPDGSILPASLDQLKELLSTCASLSTPPPMIVANPDLVTVDGDSLAVMPGTLAAFYRGLGGPVQLMGKPDPVIYEAAGQLLQLPVSELLAVGDSLEHDIAGAAAAGIDSLLIAGGIHADLLGCTPQQPAADATALAELCATYRTTPTYVLPYMAV